MNPFVKRYYEYIAGLLECFDRVIITDTLPEICHATIPTISEALFCVGRLKNR